MNRPRSFEEVQTYLNQLETRLAKLETQDIDLHKRRVVNASDAINKSDYTTLQQLNEALTSFLSTVNVNSSAQSSEFSTDIKVTKIRPTVKLVFPGSTAYARFFAYIADRAVVSVNMYYDGAAWQVDDATKVGYALVFSPTSGITFFSFPVGGILTTLGQWNASGLNVKDANKLLINGTQILTTQQSDIGSALTLTLPLNTTQVPNATYGVNEQGMLNSIKADLGNIATIFSDHQTKLLNQRTVNRNHGLTA